MEAQKLKNYLFLETTKLYCVLDGASVPDLPMRLYETNTPNYCLFRGELEPDVMYAAPYVAILLPGSSFSEWVLSESSGKHWGIFAHCRYSLKEMRRHCRALVNVYDEKGDPLIFRYYDPRVLRKFLPTCTDDEIITLFGKIETLFAETEDGNTLTAYTLENDRLKQTDLV
ncbi:MAG TPA: DUF4123 domain-containing protein [Pyrinomonadaceae bacterium]|jgi:hypothetical protein|nr:DUF4123 domain-containing protein [Pyrinomonadaceae bacterium]